MAYIHLFESKWSRIRRKFSELCDAEGIGIDDPVPERIFRAAGFTDSDIAECKKDFGDRGIFADG